MTNNDSNKHKKILSTDIIIKKVYYVSMYTWIDIIQRTVRYVRCFIREKKGFIVRTMSFSLATTFGTKDNLYSL